MLLPTLVITANLLPASADTVGPITVSFSNLATGADDLQHVTRTFSFPKFDMSLGSLQTVDLAFAFSGIVGGSATGATDSASFNSTINHWVFFDFTDLSDNVSIAEPSLRLTASIPVRAECNDLVRPRLPVHQLFVQCGGGRFTIKCMERWPGEYFWSARRLLQQYHHEC